MSAFRAAGGRIDQRSMASAHQVRRQCLAVWSPHTTYVYLFLSIRDRSTTNHTGSRPKMTVRSHVQPVPDWPEVRFTGEQQQRSTCDNRYPQSFVDSKQTSSFFFFADSLLAVPADVKVPTFRSGMPWSFSWSFVDFTQIFSLSQSLWPVVC